MTDLTDVLNSLPGVLVIGTGDNGRLHVPPDTLEALRKQGIESRVYPTREAVVAFNRPASEYADIVAAFHLTC